MSSLISPFRPSDISTGLVGYWKFNNDPNDSSSSGYNLTPSGSPTYTTDSYWKDGEYSTHTITASSQYFSVSKASAPNLNMQTQAVSVSAWVKLAANASVCCVAGVYNNGAADAQYLLYSNGTNWAFNITNATPTAVEAISTTSTTGGRWTHVVGTYDGANVKIYIDGNFEKATAQTGNMHVADSEPFMVAGVNRTTSYADADIKDVAVWNVVLTPIQIKSLAMGVDYQNLAYRPSNVSTYPTHWWKMNEVSGIRYDAVSALKDGSFESWNAASYAEADSTTTKASNWAIYSSSDAHGGVAGVVWNAGSSYSLGKVQFELAQYGTISGTIVAKLYASSAQGTSGVPTGSALATSDAVDVTGLPVYETFAWTDFIFSTPYSLTSGTWYCLTLECGTLSGSNNNQVFISESNAATYHGFDKPSGTWTTYANNEKPLFKTYSYTAESLVNWTLNGGSVAKESSTVKVGTYSAKLTGAGAGNNAFIYQDVYSAFGVGKGKTLTFGAWVYASSATTARLYFSDSVSSTAASSWHTGTPGWEFLTLTGTIGVTATNAYVYFQVYNTTGSAYVDGSVVREGYFVPTTTTAMPHNALTLTDNNTVLSSGGYVEGVGADFEAGASEYFSSADSADWDLATGTDFGWSAWIKLESSAAVNPVITRDNNNDFALSVAADNTLTFDIGNANILASTATVPDSTWTHVAVTRASGTAKIYIDGIEADSAADATAVASAEALNIGYDETVYFDGVMADIAYWKGYAPTAAEIKSLACALPIQRQGIVSYWKLDEQSGNRADSIGSNTLTDNNTVLYDTGKVGNAADFEATNSEYLSITDASQSGLNFTGTEVFLSAWIKPESLVTAGIVNKSLNTGNQRSYALYSTVTTGIVQFLVSSDGSATSNSVSTSALSNGVWTHTSGTYDGSFTKIYFNAVNEDSDAFTSAIYDSTADVRVGCLNDALYQDGLIDEVIIAQRYFRPEEIKAVYLKGLNGKEVTSNESSNIQKVINIAYFVVKKIAGLAQNLIGKVINV